jgi:hypothetical protein
MCSARGSSASISSDGQQLYDFFMIVCDAVPSRERMARPQVELTIAIGHGTGREK